MTEFLLSFLAAAIIQHQVRLVRNLEEPWSILFGLQLHQTDQALLDLGYDFDDLPWPVDYRESRAYQA